MSGRNKHLHDRCVLKIFGYLINIFHNSVLFFSSFRLFLLVFNFGKHGQSKLEIVSSRGKCIEVTFENNSFNKLLTERCDWLLLCLPGLTPILGNGGSYYVILWNMVAMVRSWHDHDHGMTMIIVWSYYDHSMVSMFRQPGYTTQEDFFYLSKSNWAFNLVACWHICHIVDKKAHFVPLESKTKTFFVEFFDSFFLVRRNWTILLCSSKFTEGGFEESAAFIRIVIKAPENESCDLLWNFIQNEVKSHGWQKPMTSARNDVKMVSCRVHPYATFATFIWNFLF